MTDQDYEPTDSAASAQHKKLQDDLAEMRRRYDAVVEQNKQLRKDYDDLAAVKFGVIPLREHSIFEERHRYRDHVQAIAKRDAEIILRKDCEYDGSWMKRGGRGAWFTFVRKWDRLEAQVIRADEDIFKAMLDDQREEGIIDDVGDARRYLNLLEGWWRAQRE